MILTIIETGLIRTGSILGLMLASIGLFIMMGVGIYTAYIMWFKWENSEKAMKKDTDTQRLVKLLQYLKELKKEMKLWKL